MLEKILCTLAAVAGLALATVAHSQQYPTRPVRVVLGFPAGGPTDAAGRIIAQSLSSSLGQTVIIDNRPGADGAIGAEVVAKAAPDGHTLLLAGGSNIAGVPAMRKNPPYNPVTDFVPVAFVGWNSLLLVIHAGVPAKTLGELIAHARANPGKLVVAAANPPTIFTMAQIRVATNVDFLNVTYKGDANALPDLLSGRVHVLSGGTNLLLPYVKDGRLRAVAALTRTRTKPAPDVPTIVEAGIPNFSIYGWFAFFAPAKTPLRIVERLEGEINVVLKRPDIQAQFEKIGLETGGPSRQELPAFVKDQIVSWAKAARDSGMQPQ
jgi:tripartite-type tricarboxylate transporter receptor subunit TctC